MNVSFHYFIRKDNHDSELFDVAQMFDNSDL